MYSFEFIVPNAHASLDGHFPGNTVVPGVIIIDEVIRGILAKDSDLKIDCISSIKFLRPLEPGVSVQVDVTRRGSGVLEFSCATSESSVVKGKLRMQEAARL